MRCRGHKSGLCHKRFVRKQMVKSEYNRIRYRQHGFCDDCFPKFVRFAEVLKTDKELKNMYKKKGLVK